MEVLYTNNPKRQEGITQKAASFFEERGEEPKGVYLFGMTPFREEYIQINLLEELPNGEGAEGLATLDILKNAAADALSKARNALVHYGPQNGGKLSVALLNWDTSFFYKGSGEQDSVDPCLKDRAFVLLGGKDTAFSVDGVDNGLGNVALAYVGMDVVVADYGN